MGIACHGICHRYKTKKPMKIGRYASGQKRCNFCDAFITWEGPRCPCCNYLLRQSPRNGKYKEKYLKTKREEVNLIGL